MLTTIRSNFSAFPTHVSPTASSHGSLTPHTTPLESPLAIWALDYLSIDTNARIWHPEQAHRPRGRSSWLARGSVQSAEMTARPCAELSDEESFDDLVLDETELVPREQTGERIQSEEQMTIAEKLMAGIKAGWQWLKDRF
jgi:hypothetical protein